MAFRGEKLARHVVKEHKVALLQDRGAFRDRDHDGVNFQTCGAKIDILLCKNVGKSNRKRSGITVV